MKSVQKKTAPEAATPETANNNYTTNIISEDSEKIKIVIQCPGEISRVTWFSGNMDDVLSGGVTAVTIPENGLKLIMNMRHLRSKEQLNLKTLWGKIYGAVVVTVTDGDKYVSMTPEQCQSARAWLIKHSVWEEEK